MTSKTKTLVIGLDAATFDIINPMLEADLLPNLKRLMIGGVFSTLTSTIPPLSPAAWVTTLTGLNPGAHGVLDFRHLDTSQIHGRSREMVLSTDFAGTTLFDIASLAGLRVGAFNIPVTYPPWPVNGLMVSGPVTPDLSKAFTYPADLAERLGPMGRHTSPDQLKSFATDEFRDELIWNTRRHFDYGLQLLREKGPFDLFWFHLHTLDSVQHRFWPENDPSLIEGAVTTADDRLAIIQDLYQLADEGVGHLLEALDAEGTVIILSDHGARGRPSLVVRPNVWLSMNSLFAIDKPSLLDRYWRKIRRRLPVGKKKPAFDDGIDWWNTSAFFFTLADPIGGIVVNLEGRQPFGTVSPANYESTRDRLIDVLTNWQNDEEGRPIVEKIWRREDLYHGRYVERIPDLIIKVGPEYLLNGAHHGDVLFASPRVSRAEWRGIHDTEGIFIANGHNIRKGIRLENCSLLDIAPTVLYSLHLPVPLMMDGNVLVDIFTDEYSGEHPIEYAEIQKTDILKLDSAVLADHEHDAMMERLRMLGYVE